MGELAIIKQNVPLLSFYFILGISFSFPAISLRYFLMDFTTPAQMSAMMGIMSVPWIFKRSMVSFLTPILSMATVVNHS